MPVATLLGLGAVAALLAAVVAALVRQPDAQRSAAHRAAPPGVVSPAPQQQPTITQPAIPTATAPRHHTPKTKVLGEAAHRAARGHGQSLPFTGPAPVVPTGAIGLLMLVAGSWLLVRWPAGNPSTGYDAAFMSGSSVTLRNPLNDGAIDRLRAHGHQLARPSNAATDGTSSDRTTNVSSSSPAVTANPVS